MKKFLWTLCKNPIVIVFLFILVFLLPAGLASPPATSDRTVVTTLGVDKGEAGGYSVTAVTFIPTPSQTYAENFRIFTADGDTFIEAVDNLGVEIGRHSTLAHANAVIISEEVAREDLAIILDHLIRTPDITNDTSLLITNNSAKEIIEISNQQNISGLNIDRIIDYNEAYLYNFGTNIESFYQGYFTPAKCSLVGYIETELSEEGVSNQAGGQGGSSGGQQGAEPSAEEGSAGGDESGSGSSQQGKKMSIINEGKIAVFKEGKLITVWTPQQLRGINWINNNSNEGNLKIENVTDEYFTDATLTFDIFGKRTSKKADIRDNLFNIFYDINITLSLSEVRQDSEVKKILESHVNYLSSEVKDKVAFKIKEDFMSTFKSMKDNKTDLLLVYQTFMNKDRKKFESFLNMLPEKDEYLDYVNIYIRVNAELRA